MSAPDSLAWLGLLRWSLQYNDGTTAPTEAMVPLSLDKKLFLEKVMNECVQDDNKRIGAIIKEIVGIQTGEESPAVVVAAAGGDGDGDDHEEKPSASTVILPLLMELHEILNQIDYSLSFAQQGGLPFILSFIDDGAPDRRTPPLDISVKLEALDMLSTVLQNNPQVQAMFISPEIRGLDRLCNLLLQEASRAMERDPHKATTVSSSRADNLLLKFYLTLSCCVRNHPESEVLFLNAPNKRALAILSLGVTWPLLTAPSPAALLKCLKIRSKATFLLRALITSSYGYSDGAFKGRLLADLVSFGQGGDESGGAAAGAASSSLRIVENCRLTREDVAAGMSMSEDERYDLDVQLRELRRLSISTLKDVFNAAEQGALLLSAVPPPAPSSTGKPAAAVGGDLLDTTMGEGFFTVRMDIVLTVVSRAERLSDRVEKGMEGEGEGQGGGDDEDQTTEEVLSLIGVMEVLRMCEILYAKRTGSATKEKMSVGLSSALLGLKGKEWYKRANSNESRTALPPKILSRKLNDDEDTSYSFLGGLAK